MLTRLSRDIIASSFDVCVILGCTRPIYRCELVFYIINDNTVFILIQLNPNTDGDRMRAISEDDTASSNAAASI
jgi:hypothetical protein